MSLALQIMIPVMGTLVLSSYAWGLTRKDIPPGLLWGPLTNGARRCWGICASLTVISYLYLWWLWAFDSPLSRDRDTALVCVQIVFLSSAATWMLWTISYIRGRADRVLVTLNLWTTALASVGILLIACLPQEPFEWKQALAIISGIVLVIQHVLWDAIVWNRGFTVQDSRSDNDELVFLA
jgi:hypothetical protein